MPTESESGPVFIFMRGVARFVLNHRLLVGGGLVAVTAAFSWIARDLRYDYGIEELFPDETALREPFIASEETFGRDDNRALVAFDLPDLFTKEGMTHLRELTDALAQIEGVARVTSLANVERVTGDDDEIKVERLVGDDLSPEALERARDAVDREPLLKGLYASEDQRSVGIVIEYGVPRGQAQRRMDVGDEIDGVLERVGRDGVTYHQTGIPFIRTLYGRLLLRDNLTVIPGMLLCLIVLLAVIFRRVAGVVFPLAVVLVATTWVAGFTVLLDAPLNMVTNVVTPLILVVGIADSIHILNCYSERFSGNKREALEIACAEMGLSCLLTSFTTSVGFGVLLLTNIPALRELGLFAVVGVASAYLTTLLGLPIALSLVKPFRPRRAIGESSGLLWRYFLTVKAHHRVFLWVGLLLTVLCGALATQLDRESRLLEDLREDHPAMVARTFIEKRFGGAMPMVVLLRADVDAFRTPDAISGLAKISDAIVEDPNVSSPVGLHTVVETLHGALVPEDSERLPRTRELVAQELLLYEMSGDTQIEELVSPDFSSVRIMARAGDVLTSDLAATKARLSHVAENAFPDKDVRIDVTGTLVLAHAVNQTMVGNMVSSFLTAFLVILVTMFLMFRRWRLALLALIPNIAPLFVLLAFMTLAGISLKVTTAFIFAIAFGIAVDDTIHFLARVRLERQRGASQDDAVRAAVTGTGRAIIQTTVVLVLGCSFLLTSSFLANFNFGLLTGVTLTAALVADMTILPALLVTLERW
ncbi:RND family transporter [Myxococcota bacterium]